MNDDSTASLRAALKFCLQKGLGMIEASDVVVPLTNQCMTSKKYMRAPFLDKMEL